MRVLCVAEKPSIAKSISQILSGGQYTTHNTQSTYIKNYEFPYPQTNSFFVVTCVAGHLTTSDFPESHRKWNSCDAFDLFDAPVLSQIPKDKKTIEQNLLAQARRADTLMIWTDCDREGEHIGLEVVKVCRKVKQNIVVKRARFSAIIAQQIHRAAQHPMELDLAQAAAVEARIILDLKIGAAFTRMQTQTLQARFGQVAEENSVVSYGPCQFPTLGFVVQKYNHVKNFVPETFWYIYLSISRPNEGSPEGDEVKFTWRRGHLFEDFAAAFIYEHVLSNPTAQVTSVVNKQTKKWKPLPLTTVELQKAGSRLLKLAPKKVLDIAEKLYQQGFLSYPRTETDQYDAQFDFLTLIGKQNVDPAWGGFATMLQGGGFHRPRNGKNNDKAHPPIHPTAHAGNLAGDEKRVYEYIARRFLASCSEDAIGHQTTIDLVCGGEEFYATGLVVIQRNYLDVYPYDKWATHDIPLFHEGEEFQPSICELRDGETTKPNLLTEADLVSLMDKNGIGTDATIAQHIQTIIDRQYVIERMEGATKYLIPSTLGIGLIEGYNQIGLEKSVSKPQLRRETERRMVEVCQGTRSKNDMLIQSIEQYKEMYIIVKREFDKVITSVRHYLEGGGDRAVPGGDGGGGGGGGGGEGGAPGGQGGGGRRRNQGNDRNGGDSGDTNGVSRGRGTGKGVKRGEAPASMSRYGRAFHPSTVHKSELPPPSSTVSKAPTSKTQRKTNPPLSESISISSSHKSRKAQPSVQAGPSRLPSRHNSPTPNPGPLQCYCDKPAVNFQADGKSSKRGKTYWACENDSTTSCGFFIWSDAVPSTSTRSIPVKRTHSDRQQTASSGRICDCMNEASVYSVLKEGPNQGRKFWKCSNKDNGCIFWEWDDDPPRSKNQNSTSINSTRLQSGECFQCKQVGHWASACPNDNGNANKRSRSFGSSFNAGTGDTSITCYSCNEPGHYSKDCPTKTGAAKTKSNGSNQCYKCGETVHWGKDCAQGAKTGRSSTTSGKRGRSQTAPKSKRGRGGKKKSTFDAADGR